MHSGEARQCQRRTLGGLAASQQNVDTDIKFLRQQEPRIKPHSQATSCHYSWARRVVRELIEDIHNDAYPAKPPISKKRGLDPEAESD